MDDNGMDDLKGRFILPNYNDINIYLHARQDLYVESRIRRFWRLPLLEWAARRKVIFFCSEPDINIFGMEKGAFIINYFQKVMLMGKSEFWALLILKPRKRTG